jgi:hypothetical protein
MMQLLTAIQSSPAHFQELAATGPTLRDLVAIVVGIVSEGLVPIIIGATVIVFLFGIVRYILKSDSDVKRAEGRKFMLYGLLGLVIILSVWSIVAIFLKVIGVQAVIPQVR